MRRHNFKKNGLIFLAFSIFIYGAVIFFPKNSNAGIIDIIKDKISGKTTDLKKLEQEINETQKNIGQTAEKAKTLNEDLKSLTETKKQIEGDIKTTESSISSTIQSIEKIREEIEDKEFEIEENIDVIEESLQALQMNDNENLVEHLLSYGGITDYLEATENFQSKVTEKVDHLYTLKKDLEDKRNLAEGKKIELSVFKKNLSGQKESVLQTQKEKDAILKATKNQEAAYKKMLAEKLRLKEQFEKELFAFESELKIAIDPSKIPTAKPGVLSWPLDNIFLTQNFGKTSASGRLYSSGTHNGIDLRATDGTPVKAVLTGTIQATGNTDLKPGCYSYGKWVLIKHNNGLSSLYGHLSSISGKQGDTVVTGDVIGYSGRTGYVTGPHLHLTVLASEGVRVMAIPNEKTVNCRGVVIPLADTKAFLDPLIFLPK